MHEPIQTLIDDHHRIRALLGAFEGQLRQFAEAGEPDYDILAFGVDACAEYLEALHHRKEERLLARLRQRAPAVVAQLDSLTQQHGELGELAHRIADEFAAVRNGTLQARAPMVEAGWRFLDSYRRHLTWEEASFFPAATRVLTAGDWRQLAAEWAHETDVARRTPYAEFIFDSSPESA